MERWTGRVAVITGASAGIGAATMKRLAVDHGMTVIGAARNIHSIQELSEKIVSTKKSAGKIVPIKCDVRNEEEILSMFEKIDSEYGGVDLCVNSAGLGHNAPLLSGKTEEWKELLEVNVLGLSVVTREAIKSMRKKNVDDGHVIHISSMSGHRLTDKSEHMYAASKHAVRVLTEGLRRELREIDSGIRVTSISPGPVTTEFLSRMYAYDKALQEQKLKPSIKEIEVEDIVDAALYALSAKPFVEVHDILLRPTHQQM